MALKNSVLHYIGFTVCIDQFESCYDLAQNDKNVKFFFLVKERGNHCNILSH